jgi:nucleoside 2-deoxyribosyltransferase
MPSKVFVSMPFGDHPDSPENVWTKLFEHGLKPLESDITGLPEGIQHVPVKLWRADRNLESLALKTNVIRGIERCEFMLAVLTTSVVRGTHGLRLTNPNVLWELGYAEAIGKPIVVLADNNDLRRLPILAGLPNVCVYDHKLVQRVKSKDAPQVLPLIARGLVQHIAQASEEAKRGPVGLHGSRARFYPSRDGVDLPAMISTAQKQVDILTTNLEYFLSKKFNREPHPIATALKNGATVRIVTMDPESVIAEYRARQLVRGQDVPGYRRELRSGIIEFYERFGGSTDFHLHTYNDLPLQITTRVDHTIITSVVTIGEKARKRIQIQFNLHDEGVTESFVSHFQSMFDNSTDVTGLKWVVRPETEDSSSVSSRGGPKADGEVRKSPGKRTQRTRRARR